MKKTKLKKKIWIISSIILIAYIITLVTNPTSWLTLLPIIIPTTLLTVGIPTYAIIKNTKEALEQIPEQQPTTTQHQTIKNTQNTKLSEKNIIKENTDLIDDIMDDNNLALKDKKQMLKTLKTECESNIQQQKHPQKIK